MLRIAVADSGLTIEDMAGLAYDDPPWDDLLAQVSVDEMTNLICNGGRHLAVCADRCRTRGSPGSLRPVLCAPSREDETVEGVAGPG